MDFNMILNVDFNMILNSVSRVILFGRTDLGPPNPTHHRQAPNAGRRNAQHMTATPFVDTEVPAGHGARRSACHLLHQSGRLNGLTSAPFYPHVCHACTMFAMRPMETKHLSMHSTSLPARG